MKKRLLGAALAACVSFAWGCAAPAGGGGNSAGGSLAISSDDALLYVADADLDAVFVVDTKTQAPRARIPVGRQPEKVLLAPDGVVYVTNRLGRSVSVVRDDVEAARLDVGVEPVGLAISHDSKTLFVVNATSLTDADFGTLQAIDTQTLATKWETPVGHEPRGITLLADGRAAVSLYKDGDLVLVDTSTGRVVKSGTRVFEALNASALGIVSPTGTGTTAPRPEPLFPNGQTSPGTARPRGFEAITVSRDGAQLYVASLLSTDGVLNTQPGGTIDEPLPGGGGSAGYGAASCGSSAVAAPALLTFDAEGEPLVDDVATCLGVGASERPPMQLTSPIPETPIQGPKAIAVDATSSFLYLANFESNNVAVVPTAQRTQSTTSFGQTDDFSKPGFGLPSGTVPQLVAVGAGPTGIAVSHDGLTVWVFNAFDHSVSRLKSVSGRISNSGTVKLTTDEALSAEAAAGRRLFFSAVDRRMNDPSTGISCGTCHLEGREDGHVWNFPDGPRQTPSLQGRRLMQTAPFHWNGEFPNLLSFMSHTIEKRMGGSGVTSAMEQQLAAFVTAMPAADNPHKDLGADAKQRGRAAFDKAECGTCHEGPARTGDGDDTFTNNFFADVGTYVTTGPVLDRMEFLPYGGLNTPSLLGLSRTAPYLHDGSALSLKGRLVMGQDRDLHGKTSRLSDAELDDLVAYLKSL